MKRLMRIIILAFLILLSLSLELLAYSAEIATTQAFYQHPITKTIEDAGNNPEIGQPMVESVLAPQAMVEEVNGVLYLTIRLNMADNINQETFAYQRPGDNKYSLANYEITKSNKDTKDYRFIIPSKDVIIRHSFHVNPMGRDIVFYSKLTSFTPGNTDFVLIGNKAEKKNKVTESPVESKIDKPNSKVEESPVNEEIIEVQEVQETVENVEGLGYSHGLLTSNSEEILKIKESMGQVKNEEEVTEKAPMGDLTKASIYLLFNLIAILTAFIIVGAVIAKIYLKVLKEEKESLLDDYDED